MELVFKVYQEVVKLKVNTARILFLGWLVLSLASRVFALDTIEPTWLRFWGGGENDRGYGVAIDARGNVYVTGRTTSFGSGKGDAFLLKYTPEGELLWERTWGGSEDDGAVGLALDARDNVYVAGRTVSVGTGNEDAFLLKYTPEGELLWERTWGGSKNDWAGGIAVDARGNVYVTGGTCSFGAGKDLFLVKYTPEGEMLWEKTSGKRENDWAGGVTIDSQGNLYVMGGTNPFCTDEGYFLWDDDVFLVKYTPKGKVLWERSWDLCKDDWAGEITVDPRGDVYVVGTAWSGGGFFSVFLVKYTSEGEVLWDKLWPEHGRGSAGGVAVDAQGNVYVTGNTDFYSGGDEGAFLVKYTSEGELLWEKTWGDEGEGGSGIALDAQGNVYVTGWTSFGSGKEDAFLMRIPSFLPR